MHVLCVAEKPSIARSITGILASGTENRRDSNNKYIKNYDFDYPQTNASFTVTSVSGHLGNYEFHDSHRTWNSCDPFDLFDAPLKHEIKDENKSIETNIFREARRADVLMIWTDCDREGEAIGAEIVRVARRAKANIRVKRARFSAIIPQQIHNAAQNPVNLDQAQADAVEARAKLDLRIGAAFTRLQTLRLQDRFPDMQTLSYGPCQFPTLGFVVARHLDVKNFRPEQFWFIHLSLSHEPSSSQGMVDTVFTWKRGHLFAFEEAVALYEHVMGNVQAEVSRVGSQETKKWKPYPLTTVELQKAASRLLKMSPKHALDTAERLYQKGFVSYPRTETDQFDPQFDLMSLIQKQKVDPAWGDFATNLCEGDGFRRPRQGKQNDKAHPPIHPTAHAGNLSGDEKRVYDYITRRFLACCSKDAIGWSTTVDVLCGGEEFTAKGLLVQQKNYLLVYTYDKWEGKHIPEFRAGERFMPTVCELREGATTSPKLLTEADLVALMDKNGIGTDATIATHIDTIIQRGYVLETQDAGVKFLAPSTLGVGLIEGYDKLGMDQSFSKPYLRRETERRMIQVCEGTATKEEMMQRSIEEYKNFFVLARRDFAKITATVQQYLNGPQAVAGAGRGGAAARGGRGGARGARGGGGIGRGGGQGDGGGGGGGRDNNDYGGPGGRGREGGGGGGRHSGGTSLGATRTGDPGPSSSRNISPVDSDRSYPPRRTTDTAEPQCNCNQPAVKKTVGKAGDNKGRRFWTCANDPKCGFFQWADNGAPPPAAASRVIPEKRSYSSRDQESRKRCECNLTAIRVERSGRSMWTCPSSAQAKCGFFEWDDSGDSVNDDRGGGGGSSSTGDCFKCGQPGHWASNCTNADSGPSSKRRSFGSRTENLPSSSGATGDCYKCHRPGHWAADCPGEGGGSRGGSKTRASRGSRGGRGGSKRGRGKTRSNYGIPT